MFEKEPRKEIAVGALALMILDNVQEPISQEMLEDFINEYQRQQGFPLRTSQEVGEALKRLINEGYVDKILEDGARSERYFLTENAKGVTANKHPIVEQTIRAWENRKGLMEVYKTLSEPAQRLLISMSIGSPGLTKEEIAVISSLSGADLDNSMAELRDKKLLEQNISTNRESETKQRETYRLSAGVAERVKTDIINL